jgi:uncharacterized protein (DUF1501 family)
VLIYCLQRALWLAERFEPELAAATATFTAAQSGGPRCVVGPAAGFYVSGAARQVSWASQIWLVLAEVGTPQQRRRSCATWSKIPPPSP